MKKRFYYLTKTKEHRTSNYNNYQLCSNNQNVENQTWRKKKKIKDKILKN